MKLPALIRDIRKMSTEELREHVRKIRHNKYVVKPALQEHKAKPVRQEGKRAMSKLDKLLRGMTDEQRAALIKELEK